MGSPIAPVLANIFLNYHETNWLNNCPINIKPVLYRRYMDDTFLLFKNESHVQPFLSYLNNQHTNIKFTCETEIDNKISFLDVKIHKTNSAFETELYRKPTYTGQTTNFNSFIPFLYKLNLIKILIYRAFHISSNYFYLDLEFKNITRILNRNGFKTSLIEKCIKKFLDSINKTHNTISTAQKDKMFVKLPYYGNQSYKIRRNLKELMMQFYPQINIQIIFTNAFSISSFFQLKDKIPDKLRSSLIYKYQCGRCNSVYVGKTSRHFPVRVSEHRGLSYRTNLPLSCPPFSSIRNHNQSCEIKPEDFKIIATGKTNLDLLIKESILSKLIKPNIIGVEPLKLKVM